MQKHIHFTILLVNAKWLNSFFKLLVIFKKSSWKHTFIDIKYFIGRWFLFSKTKWPSPYLSYHLIKPLTSSQSLDKHLALHQRISGGATTGETQSELTSDYLDQDNWCVPRQNDCINWGKGNWFPPPLGHRSLLWMLGLMFPSLVTPEPPLSCHPRVLLGKDSAQLNIIR